jgi:hypothetical protein
MVLNIRFIVLVLFSSLLTGCSFQKRTLMPGYHVEWAGGQNEPSVPHASPDELAQLEWAVAGSLPNELPAVELNTSPYGKLYPVQVRKAQPIPLTLINNPTPAVALEDPTPWAETYEEQKRFENLGWAAGGLGALLGALGAPEELAVVMGLIGYAFLALSRRKRREVMEIKEINGYDTTLERERMKRENQFLAGAAVLNILGAIVLIGVLIAFGDWLFGFF